MLCVKPVDDIAIVEPILKKYRVTAKTARLLLAQQRGETLGFVLVEPKADRLYLHAFEVCGCMNYELPANDTIEIAEYLVRAAGSYARNRMLVGMDCRLPKLAKLLSRFGFKQNSHKYSVELKELFKKCENCGH